MLADRRSASAKPQGHVTLLADDDGGQDDDAGRSAQSTAGRRSLPRPTGSATCSPNSTTSSASSGRRRADRRVTGPARRDPEQRQLLRTCGKYGDDLATVMACLKSPSTARRADHSSSGGRTGCATTASTGGRASRPRRWADAGAKSARLATSVEAELRRWRSRTSRSPGDGDHPEDHAGDRCSSSSPPTRFPAAATESGRMRRRTGSGDAGAATRTVLGRHDAERTLIFDEVDAGSVGAPPRRSAMPWPGSVAAIRSSSSPTWPGPAAADAQISSPTVRDGTTSVVTTRIDEDDQPWKWPECCRIDHRVGDGARRELLGADGGRIR